MRAISHTCGCGVLVHADLDMCLRMEQEKSMGGSLNTTQVEAGHTVHGLFKLHVVNLFCAAFSRYCSAVAVTVVGFSYVLHFFVHLQCPDVLLSLLSLSLFFSPPPWWTSCFFYLTGPSTSFL